MSKEFTPSKSLAAPKTTIGVVGWLRQNLFSSPLNTVLTLVFSYLTISILYQVLDWALISAQWQGSTRKACESSSGIAYHGACWVFIKERFWQFMFGRYPASEYWRMFLIIAIIAVGVSLLLIKQNKHKAVTGLLMLTLFPLIAFYLLSGGVFGLEYVPTDKWGGLSLTLIIAAVGMTVSFPLGIILALGRRSKMPIARTLSISFIEFVRGVPLITILFMASVMIPLFLPEEVNFDKLLRALIGISLFQSAYMAEVVRSGLQGISKGQYEAANSMGFNFTKGMTLIIMPQALKLVIPGIVNTFITLFKDTSLVYIIAIHELLKVTELSIVDPYWLGFYVEGYVFAALIYWMFCFGMSKYSIHIEKKLHTGH